MIVANATFSLDNYSLVFRLVEVTGQSASGETVTANQDVKKGCFGDTWDAEARKSCYDALAAIATLIDNTVENVGTVETYTIEEAE